MANVARTPTAKNLFSAGPSCSSDGVKSVLTNLPSFDSRNFSKFTPSSQNRNNVKRPSVYLPLKEQPNSQFISTEKTNILLRYLHYQTGHKKSVKRRDPSPAEESARKFRCLRDDPSSNYEGTDSIYQNSERTSDDD